MDGYEVCQRLKSDKSTQHIPIIFLTSLESEEDETKGLKLGAVDYITKPFNPAIMKQRIQTHLELKQHRDQLQSLVDKKVLDLHVASAEVAEKETYLQSILKSAPVGIGLIVDRKFLWVNQRMEEMVGHTSAELEGKSARMLYQSEEEYERVGQEKYAQIHQSGTGSVDTRFVRKDGSIIDVFLSSTPLSANDLSVGVIFTALDVTEWIASHKDLEEKEVLYRELFNNMSSGVAVYSAVKNGQDFLFEDLNLSGLNISQVELQNVVGKKVSQVFPGVKSLGLFSVFQKVWKTGIPESLPSSHYKDGILDQWLENYVYKLPSGQIVSIYDDHTEKKMNEEAIRKAKEEWEATFDAMSDMVTIHDRDMRIVRANKATHEFFGADYGQLNGKMCCEVFWGSSDTCPGCSLPKAIKDEKAHSEILSYNVRATTLLVTTAPIPKENGQAEYFVHITRDITEQRQLEKEASRASRLASLGELAAGIAHEINNPNALILYNSDILDTVIKDLLLFLGENPPVDSTRLFGGLPYREITQEIPKLLPTIYDSAQRIKSIVNDLRDFARQDSSYTDETIDVNQAVQAAVRLVNNTIKKATDHFTLNLAEMLPVVTGVKGRLDQVIINLLLNACQALENRSKAISVTTAYDADTDQLHVMVTDEGIGMKADVMEHILEPFVTSKREQGGTGLGLSVSARIVKEYHGTLRFKSAPGEGTTATISLPVRKEGNRVN
ncbi:MAG: hypothetical protein BA863_15120 [Desulfovibrio sp. S3730MH75]|nr:MAG: hypothetical protein BA863_15120 [Desulfovibrio sp. S3730MH75]